MIKNADFPLIFISRMNVGNICEFIQLTKARRVHKIPPQMNYVQKPNLKSPKLKDIVNQKLPTIQLDRDYLHFSRLKNPFLLKQNCITFLSCFIYKMITNSSHQKSEFSIYFNFADERGRHPRNPPIQKSQTSTSNSPRIELFRKTALKKPQTRRYS